MKNCVKNEEIVKVVKDGNISKIEYLDGKRNTFIYDNQGRIIYHNINGELITKTEYSDSGNVIRKIEFDENGYEITEFADSPIVTPIRKEVNGEKITYQIPMSVFA